MNDSDRSAGGGASRHPGPLAGQVGGEVATKLARVRHEIALALRDASRPAGAAKLVAVSKTKSIELIAEAAAAGQADFGENYAQETAEKIARFPDLRFHFIGSLQSNKAKLVVGVAALIHSVDRLSLALEIDRLARAKGCVQDVLLQLQVGGESTKSGASLTAALEIARKTENALGIRLCGVMCLPPLSDSEAVSRGYFKDARESFVSLKSALSAKRAADFSELSMGTTSDFRAAIFEGATLVRVGTAIFGERD